MLHLLKYSTMVKIRAFNVIFWPLFFPLIMATFFYFAFGTMEEADFETVQTAVVEKTDADQMFLEFLEGMETGETHLVKIQEMSEEEARRALEEKKVSGIFYVEKEIRLMVGGNGISESILQSLLEGYQNGKQTMETVAEKHPEGLQAAAEQMEAYEDLLSQKSLGGRTTDGNMQFFYALIGMACLYGAFIGLSSAIELQANLTPLAARRCITPTHKLKLVVTELLSSFILHFLDVVVLLLYLRYVLKLDFAERMPEMLLISLVGSMIGVSMGVLIGSIGRMREGAKIGILLAFSMTGSFMAGLMNAEMKYMVDRHAPVLNRLNPAAVISDAFYCINVYDDTARFTRSLITLGIMCVVLTAASFFIIRRERYDSI